MLAAGNNPNPEVISTLLNAGADLKAQNEWYGWTPLMVAAGKNQNPEVITTLLGLANDLQRLRPDALRLL